MCSVDGCGGTVVARGWCRKHYTRWHQHGDPLTVVRRDWGLSVEERFWRQVNKTASCWFWTSNTLKGYGRFASPVGNLAHRYSYWLAHGSITAETIDHECHNLDRACFGGPTCPHRRCVNPAHLIQRPAVLNVHRGPLPPKRCPSGHEYPADAGPIDGNRRRCPTCKRSAAVRQNQRRRTGRPLGEHNRSKTHCAQGHAFDEGNTRHTRSGRRACRACARNRATRAREARRAPK